MSQFRYRSSPGTSQPKEYGRTRLRPLVLHVFSEKGADLVLERWGVNSRRDGTITNWRVIEKRECGPNDWIVVIHCDITSHHKGNLPSDLRRFTRKMAGSSSVGARLSDLTRPRPFESLPCPKPGCECKRKKGQHFKQEVST